MNYHHLLDWDLEEHAQPFLKTACARVYCRHYGNSGYTKVWSDQVHLLAPWTPNFNKPSDTDRAREAGRGVLAMLVAHGYIVDNETSRKPYERRVWTLTDKGVAYARLHPVVMHMENNNDD